MASKTFVTPFADSGDKTAVPDASQPSGDVSYTDGFTLDYELDQVTEPSAKDVPRQESNQLYFDITEFLQEIQQNGLSVYNATYDYAVGAHTIASDGLFYRALIVNGPASTVRNPVGDTSGSWLSNRGDVRGYVGTFDFEPGDISKGSDDVVYTCLIANGPTSTVVDPVGDTTGRWESLRADIVDYVATFDYAVRDYSKGTDGLLYRCAIVNGPSTSTVNPVGDLTGTWVSLTNISNIGGSVYGLEIELAADADHDITINPGACPAANGFLNSAITKRLDGSFLAGDTNGGLSDGGTDTPAADTTYHIHMIKFISTGVIDVYFDVDKDAANMPAGYSHICRITSMYTDGSANWIGFTNSGDEFRLSAVVVVATPNPGTSPVTPVLPVPVDIQVLAHLTVAMEDDWDAIPLTRRILITSMDQDDVIPGSSAFTMHTHSIVDEEVVISSTDKLLTDTLGRFRYRLFSSAAGLIVFTITSGWTDHRRGLS